MEPLCPVKATNHKPVGQEGCLRTLRHSISIEGFHLLKYRYFMPLALGLKPMDSVTFSLSIRSYTIWDIGVMYL